MATPTRALQTEKLNQTAIPRQAWVSLVLLTLCYAIYALDKSIVAVVIEPLKHEFRMTDGQVGLLTGLVSTLPFLVTCIPLGMLADRVNRKWLLVALVSLWSVSTAFGGFATSLMFLAVSRAAVAAFEAGFTPLGLSILSDRFPPRRHPTAMGIFNVGPMLGVVVALSIGGMVAATYGWRWAFFLAGIPGLIMALMVAMVETDPPRGAFQSTAERAAASARPRLGEVFAALRRSKVAMYCAASLVLCSALPNAISIWLPSFLVRVHQLPLQQAGMAAAAIGLTMALGAGTGGIFADWLGRHDPVRKLLAPILGCSGATLLAVVGLLFVDAPLPAILLLATGGFITTFYGGVGYAFVLGNMPAAMRSTTAAIVLVVTNVLAGGLGSLLVGVVSDLTVSFAGPASLAYGLASTLVLNLAGAGTFWLAMRHLRKQAVNPSDIGNANE